MTSPTFESLKWIIRSQQAIRVISFRYDENQKKFATDLIEVFWSVGIIGVILGLSGYFGYDFYWNILNIEITDRTTHARSIVILVEVISTGVCSIYFLFNAIMKRHLHVQFMEKMEKVDELLRKNFKVLVDYSLLELIYFLILAGIFIYYLIFLYIVMEKDLVNYSGVSIFKILYSILGFISTTYTLAFVGYVTCIFLKTSKLNNQLKQVVRIPPEILATKFESKTKMCLEVMKYTKLHRLLITSVGDLNEVFGFPLVMTFAHDFVLLTSLIFMMFYLAFYDGWEASQLKIITYMFWLIPNMIKISLSCLSCHFARNEIETCSQYLRKFSYEANEDDISDLVDMFALQTIHLKTEFTANNFFSIDMSLFYKIISASTTYLVILIQFKNYDDDVDNGMKGNVTNSSVA